MTDEHDDGQRNPQVEAARARLQEVATRLCTRLDPLDVAGSYLAIGVALVAGKLGKDGAAKYLRELAHELDEESDAGWGGNA